MRSMRIVMAGMAAVIAAQVLLPKCRATPTINEPPTAEGLADTVERLARRATKDGGRNTYSSLASTCQAQVTADQWKQVIRQVGGIGVFTRISFSEASTRNVTPTSGEATISVTEDGRRLDDIGWLRFVYENNGWRFVDCDLIAGYVQQQQAPP